MKDWAINAYEYEKEKSGPWLLVLLLCLVISFFSTALFCAIIVWALKLIGIVTISTWVVAFSWKLVWIVFAVRIAFTLLFRGGKKS